MHKDAIRGLILTFIVIILFLGGLGVETVRVQATGVSIGIILLLLIWVIRRKLQLPRYFVLYTLFLFIFLVNIFSTSVNAQKSLESFSLFLSGGFMWVFAYNYKKELTPYIDKLVVFLGLIFAGLYFYNRFLDDPALVRPWSLYLSYSAYRNHNNIGDLWAVVLTVVFYYLIKKPKNLFLWFLTILGWYLLLVSESRAAYVSLAVGLFYIAKSKGFTEKYRKLLKLALVVIVTLFLVVGTQKTTLFTRQYYIQGVLGFIHHPEGVGVGNFGVISENPENQILGLSHFSSVVHNLPLEILSGLGILGFVFIYWLFKVFQQFFADKDTKNLVYKAVFLTLFVDFFFHSSYFIPTMLWLWFLSLGLM